MEEETEALEKLVKEQKELLRLSQFSLKQLKQKNKKLFIETKFGVGLLKVSRVLTSPFAKLNNFADKGISDPKSLVHSKVESRAKNVLNKASEATRTSEKKSHPLVRELISTLFEIEEFETKFGVSKDLVKVKEDLRYEIDRLRKPGSSMEDVSKMNDLLKQLVPTQG